MALQNYIGGGEGSGLVETGISAAGTTQGTATTLYAQNSDVSTVASGSGVILNPVIQVGTEQSVFNSGSNPLNIYPPSGFQINALPTNGAIILPINTGVLFQCVSTTRIFGVLSA